MRPLKPADRIRLLEMPEDPNPIPTGTTGTVLKVASFLAWDQVSVKWDNGRTLMLAIPPDVIEIIGGEELFFLAAEILGREGGFVDNAFVVSTEKDRDEILHAARFNGNSSVRPITRDEAFEIVPPDKDGRRTFYYYGGGDYLRL